jgi:serine/threonine protein kinase
LEQNYDVQKNLSRGYKLHSRYEIISSIKKGGMSKVYLAKDCNLNSLCAVKELFIHILFSGDEKDHIVKRFKEEAEYLAKLRHPSLPVVTDYFEENSYYYIIMEYIIGNDLESMLKEKGNPGLTEIDVLKWSLSIGDVLKYLHSQNPPIVYSDLKPSNLMLRAKDSKIVLVDFGSARVLPHDKARLTGIGTEGYAPPEQYIGEQDPRSDIYSFGATIHHLLTGKGPYIPFEFQPVKSVVPSLSQKLEQIVIKSLKRDKNKRYQNVEEMTKELKDLYNQLCAPKNQAITISSFIKSRTDVIKKSFKALMNLIKKSPDTEQEKISVMVVDDEFDLRDTSVEILSSFNDIDVIETAENGLQAIEKYKKMDIRPNVIVMDVYMPEMDGISATEQLTKFDPSCKIVMLTALSNQETVLKAFKAGAVGYIVKGSRMEFLAEAVREAHRGGSPIGPDIAKVLLKEFFPTGLDEEKKKKMKLLEYEKVEQEKIELNTTNLQAGNFCDFLTEMSLSKFTGKLNLAYNNQDGFICFDKGEIVQAGLGTLKDEKAIYSFPLWNNITVKFEPGLKIKEASVRESTNDLLINSLSVWEEWNKMKEIITSPESVFKISLSKNYQVVSLSSKELEVLAQLKGNTSLMEVAHRINKSYFEIAETIYNLCLMGIMDKVE